MEKTYFQSDTIWVTNARLIEGTKTYPISSIVSVDVQTHVQRMSARDTKYNNRAGAAFLVVLLSAAASVVFILFLIVTLLAALTTLAFGIAGMIDVRRRAITVTKATHIVTFKDGSQLSIVFNDQALSDEFSSAIGQAMDAVLPNSSGATVAQELAELARLRDAGILDSSDWDRARTMFLGKKPDAQRAAADQLRQLQSLLQAGVLSEGEFNMKKWDILARTD